MKAAQLQQCIYDRLKAVAAVNDNVVGIYTKAPQAAQSEASSAFPFITIGPATSTPSDDKDQNAIQALVDVHIWSRSQSALAWRGLGDAVYDALQLADITVAGANVIECRFEDAVDFADPDDGRTWHYVLTFRVLYYLEQA